MPERKCDHFTKDGYPKALLAEGAHGELRGASAQEVANYRCPCERGDPQRNLQGYPLQPHTV
jgi:hypothetical protein